MSDPQLPSAQDEGAFHTYTTHHIPWWVRLLWIGFWVGLVWYLVKFAMPAAKDFL